MRYPCCFILLNCLPVLLSSSSWMVHASDDVLADPDYLLSLEQERLHIELEHVNELPYWWTENDPENGGYRLLAEEDLHVEDDDFIPAASNTSIIEELDDALGYRRLWVRASAGVTTGFCLKPLVDSSMLTAAACRTEGQTCGNGAGQCCSDLSCRLSGGVRKCTAACLPRGRECSSSSRCCSKQCMLCSTNCLGHCGLAEEKAKDNIQAFYYPWYANLATDGQWRHWNTLAKDGKPYDPLHKDLPSSFFPRLDAYSSSADGTLDLHMYWLRRAGIGTIILSWWGKDSNEDKLVWEILNAADSEGLKVGFNIEPYGGGYVLLNGTGTRTPQTARDDVKYIIDTYGCHRAMYRRLGRPVFLFFAARSYKDGSQTEWKQVWDELHADVRYNPVVIAHDVNLEYRILKGGWDGGHDYGTKAAWDASPGWKTMAQSYEAAGKILYLTVSPGYNDTRVRFTGGQAISREKGALYQEFWSRARGAKRSNTPIIITTFNEYHEGTQIEPSHDRKVKAYTFEGKRRPAYTYENFEGAWGKTGEDARFAYIDKTREYANLFRRKK